MSDDLRVGVCLKWVDQRPELDARSGVVVTDDRFAGASSADQAALEWAITVAAAWGGEVVVVTVGPPAADAMLRDALACGAHHAVRVDRSTPASSDAIAAALAPALAGCALVWCGDHSLDRGSGSVPAYLAAELGAAQALGLVDITIAGFGVGAGAGSIDAIRRLDGGRREHLHIEPPAVLSVEGSTARLRRAGLAAVIATRTAKITVLPGPARVGQVSEGVTRPFRPRARVLSPPQSDSALERIHALMAGGTAGVSAGHGAPVALDPDAAADRILDALREWGYELPATVDETT